MIVASIPLWIASATFFIFALVCVIFPDRMKARPNPLTNADLVNGFIIFNVCSAIFAVLASLVMRL